MELWIVVILFSVVVAVMVYKAFQGNLDEHRQLDETIALMKGFQRDNQPTETLDEE